MERYFKIARWSALILLSAGLLASLLRAHRLSLWLASPALAISAWAAFGHVITLDDDYPGGWSNPENSQAVWRQSLLHLAAKLGVFASIVAFAFWQYASVGAQ